MVSSVHPSNARSSMMLTLSGMIIAANDVQFQKALLGRVVIAWGSCTEVREVHSLKALLSKYPALLGIVIDFS